MGLNTLDLVVIAAYLAGVTLFGLRFRRKQSTLKGYFLADRTIPWWAIMLSIVSAETSTLTVIGVPALAYDKDFRFLQLAMGYLAGRILVTLFLLPQYFKGELATAYQLIAKRFGGRLHSLTAAVFLVTRAAAEGVRVFAVAIVIRIALGGLLSGLSDAGRDIAAIAIVTALTVAYTFEGGMAAVIWTDVVQLSIYATGAVIAALSIAQHVPGGWETIHAVASQADKFRVFDFSWSPSATYTLWSGVLGGALLTTASHGTDQLIVQRLLAARNRRDASLALLASGVVVFALFTLFLLIGAMLYVYYSMAPPAAAFTRSDMVFPTYVVTRMPHGISGLLISAILAAAMSNLSAALNAMASTTTIDFYGRFFPRTTEERRVTVSRRFTIGWAVLLFALAIAARHGGRVLEMGLSIASVAYGGLLGVFLLGVLTKTAIESGAMIGMVTGFALNVYMWLFTNVAFTWYVALGSGMTFIVGLAASFLLDGGSDAGLRAGLRQSGEA